MDEGAICEREFQGNWGVQLMLSGNPGPKGADFHALLPGLGAAGGSCGAFCANVDTSRGIAAA